MQNEFKKIEIITHRNFDDIINECKDKLKNNFVIYGEYLENDSDIINENFNNNYEHTAFVINDIYRDNNKLFIDIKTLQTYFGKKLNEILNDETKSIYTYLIDDSFFMCHIPIEFSNEEVEIILEDEEMHEEDCNETICDEEDMPEEETYKDYLTEETTDYAGPERDCDPEQMCVEAYIAKYDAVKMELVLDTITVLGEIPEKYDIKNGCIWFKDFMFHFFDNTLRYTGHNIDRNYFIARGLAIVYKMRFIDNNLTASSLRDAKDNYELAKEYYNY